MDANEIKTLFMSGDSQFWNRLAVATRAASGFEELFALSSLRKKAHARPLPPVGALHDKLRLALIGGYSLYPFCDVIEHICEMEGFPCELWLGDFDNYISEIMDETSALYAFGPQVVMLLPSGYRCKYSGKLTDQREVQQAEASRIVESLLTLVRTLHEKARADVIVTNFLLPARHDLGAYRSRTLGSDWSFRKWVNLELGLNAPPYLYICDLEFLVHRLGGIQAHDARGWFESKQLGSPALLAALAREVAHLIGSMRRSPKKMLILDLDNTLWGGVVAEDGIEAIEIGNTSPRGEAFKAFQEYISGLKERGTLLAVCSKNDYAQSVEVFAKHPEMVLRMSDFVAFKANWEPKSENLRRMAAELNLELDSFAFVDDNPAEIEIVRQFAPEVATILLGPDPSEFVTQLEDCRLFEPRNITAEDVARTANYQSESKRKALSAASTDMGAYLQSLEMEASICEFEPVNLPRVSQLINKSNQFNLTTCRRSEADLSALMQDPNHIGFSVRLRDRFGDHGLISVLIAKTVDRMLEVDTWVMSCRVLKRQVEDEVLNELVRLAKLRRCAKIKGAYRRSARNVMVRDFYKQIGFTLTAEDEDSRQFEIALEKIQTIPTRIQINSRAYEPK
jgi:FkbH-like protein